MGILGSILASPAKGLGFVFTQIRDNIDRELYDETIWQQKLLDLQMSYDMGQIDEETYQAQEEAIVEQLDLISAMRYGDEEEEYDEEYDEQEEIPAEYPEPVHHQIEVFHDSAYSATTH
jgi:hypothetical protein